MLLAPLAGCTSSTDDSPVEEYEFSVYHVGTPTSDMDLLFVLQLDSNVSIDFTDIHIDLGAAMGCTNGREGCDYAEQGDMDGLWEQGERLEIYEFQENWCDSGNASNSRGDCTEINLDIYINPRSGTQFSNGRSTIQMN
ncbi:hypothetical protein N9V58_01080 [Candidatus Poseidoniales archaeon]|nr:hypothetical protein [Candidatus Poseidoniales archaeon]MDA8716100.1 hypothetical protein [Candidatus Poseidoniales archaeon]MDA8777706.1 hypothetical protein [Candidatus Poseidoniales archaeon]MDB2348372.1 hypothetical protein [Candidatus Poseidoniales archaeon]MDC3317038.1 hypothetical protein [Candidatus Poseidoniaceae archaeon]